MEKSLAALKTLNLIKSGQLHGSTRVAKVVLDALGGLIKDSEASRGEEVLEGLKHHGELFIRSRPTSVLLINGVKKVLNQVEAWVAEGLKVEDLRRMAYEYIEEILKDMEASIVKVSEIGARRVRDGDTILTHGFSSTVYSILEKAYEDGRRFSVIATESRPECPGRMMAVELSSLNIPVTLIIDSAARYFMKDVDKVIIGAEAIAANGAVVSKIGTSAIALAAHEARVRVFAAASVYKFSSETMLGELISIEERDQSFILSEEERRRMGGVMVRNPAFDITPPEYIDLIITERGAIPPQAAIFLIKESYGWLPMELEAGR